jgi:hypothetical protein
MVLIYASSQVRDTMVDMVLATDNATHALHLGEVR